MINRDDDPAVASKGARTGRVRKPRGAKPRREEHDGKLAPATTILAASRLRGELAVLNLEAGKRVVGQPALDGLRVVHGGRQRRHESRGVQLARMGGLVD